MEQLGLTGLDLARWTQAQTIAQEVVEGDRRDPTGGARYFGNGEEVRARMARCARANESFTFGTLPGTDFHFSNGDSTSADCSVR